MAKEYKAQSGKRNGTQGEVQGNYLQASKVPIPNEIIQKTRNFLCNEM